MSADQRQNNGGGGPPTNHNNNNTNANNNNSNNNNNNAMNPGMPVGMHGLQPGMAGMQASLQAGMPGAMQGMPASLQASMQSGMRSPVSQVQLIHSPLPGPPYLSQFPYNQQLMLQNAAVQGEYMHWSQFHKYFRVWLIIVLIIRIFKPDLEHTGTVCTCSV